MSLPDAPPELDRRWREAGAEELLELVRRELETLPAPAARAALANPFITAEVVELLAAQSRLLSFYELRRELVRHPLSPQHLALRLAPGLYWRDLAEIALDMRIHPRVRREADLCLGQRLGGLSVGEKVSLARRASPALVGQMRHDPSPRVIAALLENPRLTEGLLAPLAHSDSAQPAILDLLAGDRRWGVRYDLNLALVRNPHLRLVTALQLLSSLRKIDLRAVAADLRLAAPIRHRARLLLGELGRE
jgi:hypothetical protein